MEKKNRTKNSKESNNNKKEEEPVNLNKKTLEEELNNYLKVTEEQIKLKEKEEEAIKKIKSKNLETLTNLKTLKENNKTEDLYNEITEIVKQFTEIEIKNYTLKKELTQTSKDLKSTEELKDNLNLKFLEKDKLNKLYLEKIKELNNEKVKVIEEEQKKRAEIVQKCEDFMKDVKEKFESQLPDKEELINENAKLKQKLQEYIENTTMIKEGLENHMKAKEKQTLAFEEEFRKQIQGKMEELTDQLGKYVTENTELKRQLAEYNKKFGEVNETIGGYSALFTKLQKEVAERTQEILNLKKQNIELKNKEKMIDKEYLLSVDEVKNQLNAMTNLNRTLQEQIKALKEQQQISLNNNNSNNTNTTDDVNNNE